MLVKGAIFDFDGTILDTMEMWDSFGSRYIKSIGIEPKENLDEILSTMSINEASEYFQKEYGVKLSFSEISRGINEMLENFYAHEAKLKTGVKSFLEQLKEKNVEMVIATATDRPLIELALKNHGISHYFSKIFTCTEVGEGKSNPLIYRKSLEYLGTNRDTTLVFEDAFYALVTATNDNFKVVGVFDKSEKCLANMKFNSHYFLESYLNFQEFWNFIEKN